MITPPPEDFFSIVARCPGCSRRLRALAPVAWPVRVPLPGRCDACGAWLKVDRQRRVTATEATTTEAATTTTTDEEATKSTVEGTTKAAAAAQETDVSGAARVGPAALFEWPLPSLAELEEK